MGEMILENGWREIYEERAAIREYDGELPRRVAEQFAMAEVRQMMEEAGDG